MPKTSHAKDGYERFERAYVQWIRRSTEPMLRGHKSAKALLEVSRNFLFGLPGPKVVSKRLTHSEWYARWVRHGFQEIQKSHDTLLDIQFYIGQFPFKRSRISKDRYLQFHFESYLHEIYVLQVRLLWFLSFLTKQFKAEPNFATDIEPLCAVLEETVIKTLKPIVTLRGVHVHQSSVIDNDVDRLGAIALRARVKGRLGRAFRQYHDQEWNRIKNRMRTTIRRNNKGVRKLLDVYFDLVKPLVFTNHGGMIYPSRIKNSKLRFPVDNSRMGRA